MVLNKVSKKEAEIASSAEYLWKDSGFSLVNQTNLTVRVQVFRERRTHTRRKIVWKKKAWACDEVTSPSSLFSRVLCSRECDRSALKTYLCDIRVSQILCHSCFSDVNADFSDVNSLFTRLKCSRECVRSALKTVGRFDESHNFRNNCVSSSEGSTTAGD